MFRRWWQWYRRIRDNHRCEYFTPWEKHTVVCERSAVGEEIVAGVQKVRFTKTWQEQRCTECNRHFQMLLEYGGRPPDDPPGSGSKASEP